MDAAGRRDRLAGVLLGTALGDALGLPAEGMTARAIVRRFGTVNRFHLLGATGYVSDDTEQAALVAEALIESPADLGRAIRRFRRGLLEWFCRLPWGIGRATGRACLRLALGMRRSGVPSAGNGAAMRAAIIGAFYHDRPDERRAAARGFAEVTHIDRRAVEGAVYVAEVAAAAVGGASRDLLGMVQQGRAQVTEPELSAAIDRAIELARSGVMTDRAAEICGVSGYVVWTLAFATYLFLRHGDAPLRGWAEGIAAGGDADTIAAILGAWMGAHVGESRLPAHLIARLHDGPFGPTHLRHLAEALVRADDGAGRTPPKYSRLAAVARNLMLWPVILAHGLRRLVPF